MKISTIIAAAGLTVAAVTMSGSASAQNWRDHRGGGYDQRHDRNSSWDRGHHRGWDRWNRGHRSSWNRHHRGCRTFWRHHRRVTVCYR
ncbi:MAG: hypothetical protein V4574_17340 [Pseudomonadota bacterium]